MKLKKISEEMATLKSKVSRVEWVLVHYVDSLLEYRAGYRHSRQR